MLPDICQIILRMPSVAQILQRMRQDVICTYTECFESYGEAHMGDDTLVNRDLHHDQVTFYAFLCILFVYLLTNIPPSLRVYSSKRRNEIQYFRRDRSD